MSCTRTYFALLSLFSGQFLFSQSVSWSARSSEFQRVFATNDAKLVIASTYEDTGLGSQNDTLGYADETGNIIWQQVFPGQMRVTALTPAWDSGFLVGGYYSGNFLFNGHQFTSGAFDKNLWLAKYEPDGSFAWVTDASSNSWIQLTDISCRSGSIALCGIASDSVDFMGDLRLLPDQEQGFVVTLDQNGGLKDVYYSQSTTTVIGTDSFESMVLKLECGLDADGSVYLLVRSFGRTQFGAFSQGYWYDYNEYGAYSTAIVKLDESLHPLRLTTLDSCIYYCYFFDRLNVNADGECYYTRTKSYAQSGNDDQSSSIRRLNADGSQGPIYELSVIDKNSVADLRLDRCERPVFTGYKRGGLNSPTIWYKLLVGQLEGDLTMSWQYEDSVTHNIIWPKSLAILHDDDYFVMGGFSDTLQFGSNPAMTGKNGGFYAHIDVPASFKCNGVGIGERSSDGEGASLYPNPSMADFYVRAASPVQNVSVYDIQGNLRIDTSEIRISTKDLLPGVYIVKVATVRGTSAMRLVVTK